MVEPTRTSGQASPETAERPATAAAEDRSSKIQHQPSPAPAGGSSAGPPVEGPDVAELEDRWRRALADLDNLRKRYARELGRERAAERELVTAAFLPVLDTIDRALEHADAVRLERVDRKETAARREHTVVSGLGYGREDEVGVPFDPTRHEVVGVVDADSSGTPPGSVAAVLRPGYGAPGRQLRPAAVTVAQRSED